MLEQAVFSVVIPAYRGGELWKTAVDSVLQQDYPQIELILADDGTPGMKVVQANRYIESNRRGNLLRFQVLTRNENIGTVENLRQAHNICTGRYLLHLAMDDVYCDSQLLTKFAAALDEKTADVLGIYAGCVPCDGNLRPLGESTTPNLSEMTTNQQFVRLTEGCCIHMGATAFLREEFMATGDFDPLYRFIEDWPFFLRSTLQGKRFTMIPVNGLLYRQGGITDAPLFSPEKKGCFRDHLRLCETMILPHMDLLPKGKRRRFFSKYLKDRMEIGIVYGNLSTLTRKQKLKYCRQNVPATLLFLLKRNKKPKILWGTGALLLLLFVPLWGVALYTVLFTVLIALRRRLIREQRKDEWKGKKQ